MKVLIVSQYFAPENVPIPGELASELSARGHQVRVLTGFPNYPTGKIFPGYSQRLRQRSVENGVEICRVPLYVDHSQRLWARMLNYFTFALSAASAYRIARDADVVYVYATQMTPALGPWLWRITGGVPYVLHVQDLWPDSVTGSSISGGGKISRIIGKVLTAWISRVYNRASAVIGIAPTMVETLVERGVGRERAELVFNWSDDVRASAVEYPAEKSSRSLTRIVYAGNIGEMQDLETAIRAAVNVADIGVRLTLLGDGIAKPGLLKLTNDLNALNIDFKDPVPRDEMPAVYAQADFGLVTLKDLPVFRGTVPSKFQAVLAHGLPVITSVQGDVRALSEEYCFGFTSDAESVQSLEDAFRRAADYPAEERIAMAERARSAAKELFSKDASITRIESILQHAADKGKKRQ